MKGARISLHSDDETVKQYNIIATVTGESCLRIIHFYVFDKRARILMPKAGSCTPSKVFAKYRRL